MTLAPELWFSNCGCVLIFLQTKWAHQNFVLHWCCKFVDTLMLIVAMVTHAACFVSVWHTGIIMDKFESMWSKCKTQREGTINTVFSNPECMRSRFQIGYQGDWEQKRQRDVDWPLWQHKPNRASRSWRECRRSSRNVLGEDGRNPQRASSQHNSVGKTGARRSDDGTSCNVPHATDVSAGVRLMENIGKICFPPKPCVFHGI